MTLDQIPLKASVFLDANILVYYFTPDPTLGPECRPLIERITKYGEIHGCTSTHVLSEMAHHLMVLEAIDMFGWPPAGATRRLQRHPSEVQKLRRFRQAIEDVARLGIEVLPVQPHHIVMAAAISQQTGLLSSDALIVAVMQDDVVNRLASNDADFDRVPGLTRFAPA